MYPKTVPSTPANKIYICSLQSLFNDIECLTAGSHSPTLKLAWKKKGRSELVWHVASLGPLHQGNPTQGIAQDFASETFQVTALQGSSHQKQIEIEWQKRNGWHVWPCKENGGYRGNWWHAKKAFMGANMDTFVWVLLSNWSFANGRTTPNGIALSVTAVVLWSVIGCFAASYSRYHEYIHHEKLLYISYRRCRPHNQSHYHSQSGHLISCSNDGRCFSHWPITFHICAAMPFVGFLSNGLGKSFECIPQPVAQNHWNRQNDKKKFHHHSAGNHPQEG